MTIKVLCRVLGHGLVLISVMGLIAPHLLGMHLTVWHDALLFASGAAALYFGYKGTIAAARTFAFSLGLLYLGLGLLGFVAPGLTARILGHEPLAAGELAPDNVVHLVLGAAFMVASAAKVRAGAEMKPATAREVRRRR